MYELLGTLVEHYVMMVCVGRGLALIHMFVCPQCVRGSYSRTKMADISHVTPRRPAGSAAGPKLTSLFVQMMIGYFTFSNTALPLMYFYFDGSRFVTSAALKL